MHNKLFLLLLSLSSLTFASSEQQNRNRSDSNSSTDTVVADYMNAKSKVAVRPMHMNRNNIPSHTRNVSPQELPIITPTAIRRRPTFNEAVQAEIQRQATKRPAKSPEHAYTYDWSRGTPPLQLDQLKTIVIKEKSCEIEDPFNRSNHWNVKYYSCYNKKNGESLGILHHEADTEKSEKEILQILEDNKTERCCCWTWKKEF